MKIYWLEQTQADVPSEIDWLSADEAVSLRNKRFAKRRADWLLGRWTAKQAIAVCLDLPPDPETYKRMEIRPAPCGSPTYFFDNALSTVSISLSHRAETAACAVATQAIAIGCDLEVVEPRSDAFLSDYFTLEEQALVTRAPVADRDRLLALLWSAKESALKALGIGLRLDTRDVVVKLFAAPQGGNDWRRMQIQCPGDRMLCGWWQLCGTSMRTMVSDPPPNSPILLKAPVPSLELTFSR